MMQFPTKIVSGGQTGVDRAALDVAILLGIDHGGWCPRGRLAEDGTIPSHYLLEETSLPHYHVRTEWNVRDSDGTLILFGTEISGGTALTVKMTQKYGKPHLLVDLEDNHSPEEIRKWLTENEIRILNVAGPRESTSPGIKDLAQQALTQVLA